jgi:hypothetical protein
MKKLRLLLNMAIIFLISSGLIYANNLPISNVIITPAAPGWGQQFNLSFNICEDYYAGGQNDIDVAVSTSNSFQPANTADQMFLISILGVDVHNINPNNASGGSQFGYPLPAPSSSDPSCSLCGSGSQANMESESFTLTMPNESDLGGSAASASTMYLLIGAQSYGIWQSTWTSMSNGCDAYITSWTLPPPPANSVGINKRVDGTLALPGDLILYSIDYSIGNGTLTITDNIPTPATGSLAFVSAGPNPASEGGTISVPATGATSGTVTWNFPNSAYTTTGTVWMLLQMASPVTTGTQVINSATGTSGPNTSTSTVSTTVESATMSLAKTASVNGTVPMGSVVTVTYFLNYSVNEGDDVLKAVRTFDDLTAGTAYTSSAAPPAGWKMMPDGNGSGQYGTWTVSDPNNNGDNIITGSVTGIISANKGYYPSLLLDDPNGNTDNVQFCDGIIEADAYINTGTYAGSDALVIIRNNGQTGAASYAYSLLLSTDNSPAGGNVAIQKCGNSNCSWPAYATMTISGSTWYSVKIIVSNNGFTFNAWVWQMGTTQPVPPTLTWTDTTSSTDPNWSCDGTYTDWRPGVGEQGNDNDGSTQDSYNNFEALTAREIANAVLYDTIPAGLVYGGSTGTVAGGTGGTPQMVTWSLGEISNITDSYTWWATTTNCGAFTNTAGLGGVAWCNNPVPIYSNPPVSFNILCGTPTVTPTLTPYISPTYTSTLTLTSTYTITMTMTITPTVTITPTFTPTPQPFTFQKVTEFPNPAATVVNIVYNLGCTADVTAKFYTISGEYLGSVEQQNTPSGNDKILSWNLENQYGNGVASGIYIYVIEAVAGNNKAKAFGKIAVMK